MTTPPPVRLAGRGKRATFSTKGSAVKGERTEVRRWTLDRCPDCSDDPKLTHMFDEPVEVLEAAPLIESLEQLAGEWKRDAEEYGKPGKTMPAGEWQVFRNCARDLARFIQSLNPQEVDTNAD